MLTDKIKFLQASIDLSSYYLRHSTVALKNFLINVSQRRIYAPKEDTDRVIKTLKWYRAISRYKIKSIINKEEWDGEKFKY